MSLFGANTSEKRKKRIAQEERNRGITGAYRKRYRFKLEEQLWTAPGYALHNITKGVFDCGLIRMHPHDYTQTWSIELRDLEFDRNPQALPKSYFLFAFPYRMDIRIDASGQITGGSTWVNYAEGWKKKYKDEIFKTMGDTDRARAFCNSLSANTDRSFAVALLKNNPVVMSLCNAVYLNARINGAPEEKGAFGERYTGEVVKHDYFGEGISLPLKTTWLQRETEDKDTEEWIRLGGLQTEKYSEEAFRRMMRNLTGIFNLEAPMHVEFSEFYRLTRPQEGVRQIQCCGLRTQTLVKDVWLKHEDLEMHEDGKGVVYG
jgi:hypothetical protein